MYKMYRAQYKATSTGQYSYMNILRETNMSHNHYNHYNQSHKGRTRVGTDLKGLFAIGPLQQFP